jgi:hypothetical protein
MKVEFKNVEFKLSAYAWLSGAHSTFSEDNNITCHSHGREVAMRV